MELFNKNLITPEEVKVLVGIDLGTLNDDANPSNKEQRYIYDCQNTLFSFIYRNYKNDPFVYFQKVGLEEREHIKMAIAYQVSYTLLNGDVANDATMISENLKIGNFNKLRISQKALDELAYCRGLATNDIEKGDFLSNYLEMQLFGGY